VGKKGVLRAVKRGRQGDETMEKKGADKILGICDLFKRQGTRAGEGEAASNASKFLPILA